MPSFAPFLVLAWCCHAVFAIAIPSFAAKHSTHHKRSLPSGLTLETYHPAATFEARYFLDISSLVLWMLIWPLIDFWRWTRSSALEACRRDTPRLCPCICAHKTRIEDGECARTRVVRGLDRETCVYSTTRQWAADRERAHERRVQ